MAKIELSYGSVDIYHDEVLGIGSYGKVCKAKCGQLPCAAKLLHDTLFQDNDPGTHNLVTKFLQECQFLSTIKHPNIVQYLGTATDPQSRRAVLLMELMDESLTRFLERLTGPLPYHSQLNICHDVALALAYLHSNAIIHRDLSSNNVLLIGEGRRAKVTDFGMSKLMDVNPRMTPLTQTPGTPAYMPPEALISPPHYSSKLDCFSHGVLTLQIITRNFPNPGDASKYVADPRYPAGRVLVQFLETERRKKDIDLIEPSHPLRSIALHCLKDIDTERPSADELCGRLTSLKREPRYTHSVEQTRGHIQRLQEEIKAKDGELNRAIAELQRANDEKGECQRSVKEKEELIEKLLDMERERLRKYGIVKFTWKQGMSAPEGIESIYGSAVVDGRTAYFAKGRSVYSYAASGNKWSKLPQCKYECFSLAVVNSRLTTIGGQDFQRSLTKTLLSFSGNSWEEVLPPMRSNRMDASAANIPTHLVVAGGRPKPYGGSLATVEVLNTETLQWSRASSLPEAANTPQMTVHDGSLYIANQDRIFSCSIKHLKSTNATWSRLASIPTPRWSSIATLRGRLLAIGGADAQYGGNPTGAIHCYDVATNSWSVLGEMPTPRYAVLTAVLPSNELVVVGGISKDQNSCSTTEIGSF